MGRDVIGFKTTLQGSWDNYQCKHYANPLSIADVVKELGKLLYHVSQGEFSLPDEYFFVAPKGPGTALLKCLGKGTLKQELMTRWDKECRNTITTTHPVELATVQATIDAFDFSTVTVLSPLAIIAGHQKTKYYALRGKGGPSICGRHRASAGTARSSMLSIAWLLASRSCSSTITTRNPCMPRWNNYAPANSHGNMKCKVRTSFGLRFPGLPSRQRLNRKPCSPVVVIDCGLTEMKLRLQGNSLRLRLTRSEDSRAALHTSLSASVSRISTCGPHELGRFITITAPERDG
jgi:hypothetical protein